MKTDNVIKIKSFAFAARIVKACQYLQSEKNELVLSKQLLRCGTSIGANIHESTGAQSRADFLSKMSIAYKESVETIYWIELLGAAGYFSKDISGSLLKDATELCRIIGKIQKTIKKSANVKYPSAGD